MLSLYQFTAIMGNRQHEKGCQMYIKCKVVGCEREQKYTTLQLCKMHYNRYRRLYQTELPARQLKQKQMCKVAKCKRLVGIKGAKGMCSYHYKLNRKKEHAKKSSGQF